MALVFPEDRPFRVLQTTDWHSDKGAGPAAKTRAAVARLVRDHDPDCLAVTGDIWCGDDHPHAAPLLLEQDCAFLDGLGRPWSICFGNHDWMFPRAQVLARLRKRRHFLLPDADPLGNCRIPVVDRSGAVRWQLIFLQTDLQWRPETVAWFQAEARRQHAAHEGTPPPAIAFYHIPLRAYQDAIDSGRFQGTVHEDVLYWGDEDGAIAPMLAGAGFVRAGFCGHSHEIDGHFTEGGVVFGYGRSTGYGGYGDRLEKGATLFDLAADGTFTFRHVYPDGAGPVVVAAPHPGT